MEMDDPSSSKRRNDSNHAEMPKSKMSKLTGLDPTICEVLLDCDETESTRDKQKADSIITIDEHKPEISGTCDQKSNASTGDESKPAVKVIALDDNPDFVDDATSNEGANSCSEDIDLPEKATVSPNVTTDDRIIVDNLNEKETTKAEESKEVVETISISSNDTPSDQDDEYCDPLAFLTTCMICKEPFREKQPLLLPCLHIFCSGCILKQENFVGQQERNNEELDSAMEVEVPAIPEKDVESIRKLIDYTMENKIEMCVKCHVCHSVSKVEKVVENVFTVSDDSNTSVDESTAPKICTSCEEKIIAVSYCAVCEDHLCEECVTAHKRVKFTKDHVLEECHSKEAASSLGLKFCKTHVTEQIKLFCETCNELTCRDCQLAAQHRDHKYKFLVEAAEDLRKVLEGIKGKQEAKANRLEVALQKISDNMTSLQSRRKDVLKKMLLFHYSLHKLISQRSQCFVRELKTIAGEHKRLLDTQKQAIVRLVNVNKHCLNFNEIARQKRNELALLQYKDLLVDYMKVVESQQFYTTPSTSASMVFLPDPTIKSIMDKQLGKLFWTDVKVTKVDGDDDFNADDPPLGGNGGAGEIGDQDAHESSSSPVGEGNLHSSASNQANDLPSASSANADSLAISLHTRSTPRLSQGNQPNARDGSNQQSRITDWMNAKTASELNRSALDQGDARPSGNSGDASASTDTKPSDVAQLALNAASNRRPSISSASSSNSSTMGHLHANSGRSASRRSGSSSARAAGNASSASQSTSRSSTAKPDRNEILCPPELLDLDEFVKKELEDNDPSNDTMEVARYVLDMLKDGSGSDDEEATSEQPSTSGKVKYAAAENPKVIEIKTDPNEDYCAVCNDGGELVCCDKCPKVYHKHCHVPPLSSNSQDSNWMCNLCRDIDRELARDAAKGSKLRQRGLSGKDLKICEKICLEVMCKPESNIFLEPVKQTVPKYYSIIKKPMDFSKIRSRLASSKFDHYENRAAFVRDVQQIFTNCFVFNGEDSGPGKAAKALQEVFLECVLLHFRKMKPLLKQLIKEQNIALEELDGESSDEEPTTRKSKKKKLGIKDNEWNPDTSDVEMQEDVDVDEDEEEDFSSSQENDDDE